MDTTQEHPDPQALLRRAQRLLETGRNQEAADFIQNGIQHHPEEPRMYIMLATCWMRCEGRNQDAVEAARRAISLDPENSYAHGVLANVLNNSAKEGQDNMLREALDAANKAIELDAEYPFSHEIRARVLLRLRRMREAEVSAREALALDPEDASAAELLIFILQRLGKDEGAGRLAEYHLERNPEDESAHSAAGWTALHSGNHQKANLHFTEALRLNPMSEGARMGLVESFRARSWFLRSLIMLDSFIARITAGRQMAFWIGGYLLYRMTYASLKQTAPWAASLLVAAWLTLVFWATFSRGLSSFLMLFDRFARRSLNSLEKWEGVVIGGVVILALGFLTGSFFPSGTVEREMLQLLALCLFISAIPASYAFLNGHYIGRWFYWAVAVFCLVCALYPAAAFIIHLSSGINLPVSLAMIHYGILTAVIFSFVRGFGIGFR
jgi:tetratricopeptide (TPR) repeat protein